MKRILTWRQAYGLGDWIMYQSVLATVSRCCPNLPIDLDITTVPTWFMMLTSCFSPQVRFVHHPKSYMYEYITKHVLYDSHHPVDEQGNPIHLIDSMVRQVARTTGLSLKWDKQYAQYTGPVLTLSSLPETYVLMPSIGAENNPQKNWPVEYFQALVHRLKCFGVSVVQVGRIHDPMLLDTVDCFMESTVAEMQTLISRAAVVVALQNGLSHWAGHLGKPTVTLYTYRPEAQPEHAGYPGQLPIIGSIIDPDMVFAKIIKLLNWTNSKGIPVI